MIGGNNLTNEKQTAQREAPIYRHDVIYAQEHGELDQYRASRKANAACKEAIEASIREHFDGMNLDDAALKDVLECFSMERVSYVLANTIQQKTWDGRFSRSNREWAEAVPMFEPENRRFYFVVESHPAVLDGFVRQFRDEQTAERAKPSIKAQLAAGAAQVQPHAMQQNVDREAR